MKKMDKLYDKKIAVTGHTSGIGKEVFEYCQFNGWNVRGYSRSNGFNIAEDAGNTVINALLRWDVDVLFNNAWYPRVQCKILKILHNQWKDEDKCIINSGSATAYYPFNKDRVSEYEKDKRELRDYCIASAKKYPWQNRCRVHNVSLGWVETQLTGKDETFMSAYEAALILVNLMQPQDYLVPELLVTSKGREPSHMKLLQDRATDNMMESLDKTHEDLFSHA